MCECGGFSVNDDGGGQVVFESPQVESEAQWLRWRAGGRRPEGPNATPKPEQFDRPRCSLTLFSSLSAGVKAFLLLDRLQDYSAM